MNEFLDVRPNMQGILVVEVRSKAKLMDLLDLEAMSLITKTTEEAQPDELIQLIKKLRN